MSPLFLPIPIVSAMLSGSLIVALWPLMRQYAMARPNARSSHVLPTPQGGGAAVITATLVVVGAAWGLGFVPSSYPLQFPIVAGAATVLAILGAFDDIRPLSVGLRLAVQYLAVAAAVAAAMQIGRVFGPPIPLFLEFIVATVAVLWFVNLTNFMDGLDWVTVAVAAPICATIAVAGFFGVIDPLSAAVSLSLLGALVGFAPFNRPAARLFLGDVGSLPIGLILAYLLYTLASAGHLAAAVILPLYSVADATTTLLRRAIAGEKVWVAHRTHFYQRATANGYFVLDVSMRIFVLQLALAAIAGVTIAWPSSGVAFVGLGLAAILVAFLMLRFARSKSGSAGV